MKRVRVAVIDSGLDADFPGRVVARKVFVPGADPLPHGGVVARVIARRGAAVDFLDAQVFGDRLGTSVTAVTHAIRWAVENKAAVINLSLGLQADRPALAQAVAAAVAAGVILVAPVPARGGPVYPAAYPDVVRVTGDARCEPDDFTWLGEPGVDLAACARPPEADQGGPAMGGASLAAAAVSGAVAAAVTQGVLPTRAALLSHLQARCRFTGRERKS